MGMLVSLSSCGILKENEIEEETLSPQQQEAALKFSKTNNCLDLYAGQFYVWHNPYAEDINEDLLTTKKDIDKRFKDYSINIFSPVYIESSTVMPESVRFGDRYYGDITRRAWFNDEEFAKIPIYQPGDKLVIYTNADMPTEFCFEKFNNLGYTIGVNYIFKDETEHYYIPLNIENFSYSSEIYKVFQEISTNDNSKATRLIIDNVNDVILDETFVDSTYNVLLGMEANALYKFDMYYGTIHKSYVLPADVQAFVSAEEGHFTTYDYELVNSTIAIITLPEDMTDGFYYVNNKGFFYYSSTKIKDNTQIEKEIDNTDANTSEGQ